jgi:glycosyltransferase involved in cell wall biosynthesis
MAATASPRVSIIIACYNYGRFLGEAIASTHAQILPATEIIVVDDGSTDETSVVARRFPDVQYLHQENKGVSAARNRGLAESTGDYIVFLDADDRLLPRAIKSGIKCFARNPSSGLVFGAYRDIDADGAILSGTLICRPKRHYYRALCQGNCINFHGSVMYSRLALEFIQGFDENLRVAEDYDVYLRIARTFSIHRHKELVAEYRQHTRSVSQDDNRMLEGTLWVLERERQYLSTRYERVLDRGVSFWIDHYRTSKQIAEAIQHLKQHGLDRTVLGQAPDLMRYAFRTASRKFWGAAELITPMWLLDR